MKSTEGMLRASAYGETRCGFYIVIGLRALVVAGVPLTEGLTQRLLWIHEGSCHPGDNLCR